MEQLALLRATTQRLITTPTEDLPRIAGFVASSLAQCSGLFNGQGVSVDDSSVQLHKLRTRVSALLQDRTPEGRLTAAVLIKSLAEISPATEPTTWESWARGLIGCLNKPDPWESKRVYLAAILRIFLLARGTPVLQREVTNPLSPSFITACLSAIKPITVQKAKRSVVITNPLLLTVLRCWNELIPDQSGTFRPFVTRIKPICLSLASDSACGVEIRQLAFQVLSSLHASAPKASAANDWKATFSNIVNAAHDTLDLTFRGVHEEWVSNEPGQPRQPVRQNFAKGPGQGHTDVVGLGPWKGIHQGILRVTSLLQWAGWMLRYPSTSVSVPLGLLLDLTARVNAVTIPRRSNRLPDQLRANPEVANEEREALWASLPTLHVACLTLLSELIQTFGEAVMPFAATLGQQVFEIFEAEAWHQGIRSHCYASLSSILQICPCVCLQLDRRGVEAMCRYCCQDLGNTSHDKIEKPPGAESTRSVQNGLSILPSVPQRSQEVSTHSRSASPLTEQARRLLQLLLEKVPSGSISHTARSELDRISILINHESAMFASVMNPPERRLGQRLLPSILPFFARAAQDTQMDLEAIVRPRMPVIMESSASAVITKFDVDEKSPAEEGFVDREQDLLVNGSEEDQAHIFEAPSLPEKEKTADLHQPKQSIDATGKRNFATMNDADSVAAGSEMKASETIETSKRTRVEGAESKTRAANVMEGQVTVGNGMKGTETMSIGSARLSEQRPWLPRPIVEQPVIYGKPSMAPAQEQSDSDSDIPAIDPALATDDEEDEDDEEDNE